MTLPLPYLNLHKPAMFSGANSNSGVYDYRLSTISTGTVTGYDVIYELSDMDLVMKLHYLRGVYYFKSEGSTTVGLETPALKAPMLPWLDFYYPVTGRIRPHDQGRPYIKCNDCGVRIIEARCRYNLDEWLMMREPDQERHLVSDKVLGPDIGFCPSALIQITRFKCGGISIGFSWAHVLGDVISATNCINLWGRLLGGNTPPKPQNISNPQTRTDKPTKGFASATNRPLSVKQVQPVGDHWIAPHKPTMSSFTLNITENKLKDMHSKIPNYVSPFEAITALIWHCLANIRFGKEPTTVTICKSDAEKRSRILSNEQMIATVTLECLPTKMELSELAMLIRKQAVDETKVAIELVDEETGRPDFLVYGANLTFVDMEGVDFYGLELKGQKPVQVDYFIDGVGDGGAILVRKDKDKTGSVVTLILLEDEMQQLRRMLHAEWGIDA